MQELYKVTTPRRVFENVSWSRACDVVELSDNGKVWEAHESLEDGKTYHFLSVYGDEMSLERM